MFANFARTVVSATGALLIGGTLMTVAVAPATAAPVTNSKSVSFADLNLSQPQGRAVLDARIRSAAKSVCTVGGSDLRTRLSEARCTRTAIAAART